MTPKDVCATCQKPCRFGKHVLALNRQFHPECFLCAGCGLAIEGTFSPKGDPPSAYHSGCFDELFAPRCILCDGQLKGSYRRHPFFSAEAYCTQHEQQLPRCFSCLRYEPLPTPSRRGGSRERFHHLSDGRVSCPDCISTAVLESGEAAALYREVLAFLRTGLGLAIPPGMAEVPVLAVDMPSLNEQRPHSLKPQHRAAPAEAVCRGLTLSSIGTTQHVSQNSVYNPRTGATSRSQPVLLSVSERREVSAVLVLYGLPRLLAASILAHEAMHVYLKLSPAMPFHLPPLVEEGLCQFAAMRYLEEQPRDGTGLRDFFCFQISSDSSPVYGQGFQAACTCCSALGLHTVLDIVRETKLFPTLH